MRKSYLCEGLPQPVPSPDGLDGPFWQGLREERLLIQRCQACQTWQWGPEWICHECMSEEMAFEEVKGEGLIFSFERVWHPVHPALKEQGPYLIVLVELPVAGNIRLVGNLLGDPEQDVVIGSSVKAFFEHHHDAEQAYTLLQWQPV